jgi:hypothetical protein
LLKGFFVCLVVVVTDGIPEYSIKKHGGFKKEKELPPRGNEVITRPATISPFLVAGIIVLLLSQWLGPIMA